MSLRWEDERYVRVYTRDTPEGVLDHAVAPAPSQSAEGVAPTDGVSAAAQHHSVVSI